MAGLEVGRTEIILAIHPSARNPRKLFRITQIRTEVNLFYSEDLKKSNSLIFPQTENGHEFDSFRHAQRNTSKPHLITVAAPYLRS